MSQNTPKFARTATVESTLHELRLAAEAGDSARVVTAAGELRSLLDLFTRMKGPLKNVSEVRPFVNQQARSGNPITLDDSGNPINLDQFRDYIHSNLQHQSLDNLQDASKGAQKIGVQAYNPFDPANPQKFLNNNSTLKNMENIGNIGNSGVGKIIQRMLVDNKLSGILDTSLAHTKVEKTGASATLRQLLTSPRGTFVIEAGKEAELKAIIDKLVDEFASTYKGYAIFHSIRQKIAWTIFSFALAKLAFSVAIPTALGIAMGSPSASAIQQAADINAGGSAPVNPVNGQSQPGQPGHPSMTNSNSFGNLGGVQHGGGAGSKKLDVNQFNEPFMNVVDYSSMYRENSNSDDKRVTTAQAQQAIPQEVVQHIQQIPDVNKFNQRVISYLQANGGPYSAMSLKALNEYLESMEALLGPLQKGLNS